MLIFAIIPLSLPVSIPYKRVINIISLLLVFVGEVFQSPISGS